MKTAFILMTISYLMLLAAVFMMYPLAREGYDNRVVQHYGADKVRVVEIARAVREIEQQELEGALAQAPAKPRGMK